MKNFKKLPSDKDATSFQAGNYDVHAIKITEENKKYLTESALSMYENEPCRICGKVIKDARKAVYAGYSHDNKVRSAHKSCWNKNIPQTQWAYPQDAE